MPFFMYVILLLCLIDFSLATEKDIVYLIQTPDYLTTTDIDELARLVYNVTDRLVIDQNDSLVSIITFQDTQEVKIDIMDNLTNDTLLPEIENLRTTLGTLTGSTKTDKALTYLYSNRNSIYTRTEKYLVLILFENSVSPGQTAFEAFSIQAEGILISVIGIGKELSATSSEPKDHIATTPQNYHYVDDITYLCWQVPNIAVFLDTNASRENIPDCPNPNVTTTTTTTLPLTPTAERDYTFWIVFGTFMGASILAVSIIVLCKCVQNTHRKTMPSMSEIEGAVDMYQSSRLGERRHTFCSNSTVSNPEVDGQRCSENTETHMKIANGVSDGCVHGVGDRNKILTQENIVQKLTMHRIR